MIKYLELNGRKYPFSINFSTLIRFKEEGHGDFLKMMQSWNDMSKLAEGLLIIIPLGIETGFHEEKPGFLKILKNFLRTGSKYGIRKSQYKYLIDKHGVEVVKFIGDFFYSKADEAFDVSDGILEEDKKKE